MKTLSSRGYRAEWTKLTDEMVRVTSRGREIGFWTPVGTKVGRWISEQLKAENSKNGSALTSDATSDDTIKTPAEF